MTTLSIKVTDQQKEFLDQILAAGEYATVSELFRELLREKMEKAELSKFLKSRLEEGLEDIKQGRALTFYSKAEMREYFEESIKKAIQKKHANRKKLEADPSSQD